MRLAMRRILCVVFLLAVTAAAQTAPKITLLKAARMLDVKSGRYIDNAAVLIEDDRIKEVGPIASLQAQAGNSPTVVDLGKATVLPGLIDVHTHLTIDASHFDYSELGVTVAQQTLWGAKYAKVTLDAGFTTVRNVGAPSLIDVALREEIDNGDLPAPRRRNQAGIRGRRRIDRARKLHRRRWDCHIEKERYLHGADHLPDLLGPGEHESSGSG